MLYSLAIDIKDDVYTGRFPDMPTLRIQGDDMADIIAIARQTVIEHLYALVAEQSLLPVASDINLHLMESKFAGCTWAIININMNGIVDKSIEVTTHIPKKLHSRIQLLVEQNGTDIETFIINALNLAVTDSI